MALSIKPYIENKERIHLIGIGGVSMNSLAELLLSKGVPVSGSDRLRTDVTARLEALGAAITYEHRPENVEGASLIVRTAAVHDENPEIVRAHELGIPVMERAEAWGHIMRDSSLYFVGCKAILSSGNLNLNCDSFISIPYYVNYFLHHFLSPARRSTL